MKRRIKAFAAIVLSGVIVLGQNQFDSQMFVKAAENEYVEVAKFELLNDGQERPITLDAAVGGYTKVAYGEIKNPQYVCNDVEQVKELLVSVPDVNKYVKDGQKVEWYSIRRSGYRWLVDGEIVDMATPEPRKPAELASAGYYLLNDGEECPSGKDFSNVSYTRLGYGTIVNAKECLNDGSDIESMLWEVPSLAKYVNDGETVEWFTVFLSGYRWKVFGKVVKNESEYVGVPMVGTSKTAVKPINTPQITATPTMTVKPTNTPQITATPTMTVKPTEVPMVVTIDPNASYDCTFRLLQPGETRPASFSELDQMKLINIGFGTINQKLTIYNDVASVEKTIKKLPSVLPNYIKSDEAVHWFAMKQYGYRWIVYGEIYNVDYEKNDVVVSTEKHVVLDTAQDILKLNKKFATGTILETKGFYNAGDGGAAKYTIEFRSNEFDYLNFKTSVGQYANYIMKNETINILQLGAGHCINNNSKTVTKENNNDALRINSAINFINSFNGKAIYFPTGEYRCGSVINVAGANYKLYGDGNDKSIIYTDNDYVGGEHFISISGASNVQLDGLTVEARETKWVPYYRQCSVMFSTNIKILNCNFYVADNVISYNGNTDRQYTNITLYSGWHDVVVDNCIMKQLGCVERGACLGIIDMWSNGCSNVSVTNCTMYQNAHDEMLGIFTKTGANAKITDIYIANNYMYASSAKNVSNKTMAITVGYDDSIGIDNILMENNVIEGDLPSNFMTFGKVQNCVIRNNTINLSHDGTGIGGVIFDGRENVTVEGNTINLKSEKGGGFTNIVKNKLLFQKNNLEIDCRIYIGAFKEVTLIGNYFHFKSGVTMVARSPYVVNDNTIIVEGYMENMVYFEYLEKDAQVIGNTIKYLYDDSNDSYAVSMAGAIIYAGFHARLNDNTITFSNNVVEAPNCKTKNKHVLIFGVGDSTPQNFIIENNTLEKYKYVRSLYHQAANVIFNNNKEKGDQLLSFNDIYVEGISKNVG